VTRRAHLTPTCARVSLPAWLCPPLSLGDADLNQEAAFFLPANRPVVAARVTPDAPINQRPALNGVLEMKRWLAAGGAFEHSGDYTFLCGISTAMFLSMPMQRHFRTLAYCPCLLRLCECILKGRSILRPTQQYSRLNKFLQCVDVALPQPIFLLAWP
jgi:hypothetical protein